MRYKTQVSNKLDAVKNALDILARGLERRQFTPEEILKRIINTQKELDLAIELVDKENETRV